MMSVLSSLPSSSGKCEDVDDDYSVDYSFALEYSGPPLSHDIPQVFPIDTRRIPIAALPATAAALKDFALPVIQPIVESNQFDENVIEEVKFGSSVRVYSRVSRNGSSKEGALGLVDGVGKSNQFNGARSCRSRVVAPGFSEGLADDPKESSLRSHEICSEISSCGEVEDCVVGTSGHGHRTSAVTFHDIPSTDSTSEESDQDEPENFLEGPVVTNNGKKGLCHRCHKRNRLAEKEVCIVCSAKYCRDCVLRAMGCMPEGRKCITCIGYRIDESKRGSLGKCSRMLKKLLTDDLVKQFMSSELSCKANQLQSRLIYVNQKRLSIEELAILQSCSNPPKKLRPGNYWYDKFSGFWGKEGEKPSQIISAKLEIGNQIREDASNGDTNVKINNRLITKAELRMLQAAGIHCEGNPHFWLSADGSYVLEGMKNVIGNLWTKRMVKIACAALSLPYPSHISSPDGEDAEKDMAKVIAENLEQKMTNKLLLIGCDQSGTGTIFKQAKIVYGVPFSEDEKQNIKFMIQKNVYSYIYLCSA